MSFPSVFEIFHLFGKSELAGKKLKKRKINNCAAGLKVICSGDLDVFYITGREPTIYMDDAIDYILPDKRLNRNKNLINSELNISVSNSFSSLPVVLALPEMPTITLNNSVGFYAFDIGNDAVDLTLNGDSTANLSGRTDYLKIDHAGSGEVKARLLISQYAELNIPGSGFAHVSVVENIVSRACDTGKFKNYYRRNYLPDFSALLGYKPPRVCMCPTCQLRNNNLVN